MRNIPFQHIIVQNVKAKPNLSVVRWFPCKRITYSTHNPIPKSQGDLINLYRYLQPQLIED